MALTVNSIQTFFKAIEDGNLTVVEAMLDDEPSLLDTPGSHKTLCRDKTPLMYALQCQRFFLARRLLQRGANAKAIMTGGPGLPVIALAVRFVTPATHVEGVDLVSALIDAGADPTDALWPAVSRCNHKSAAIEMVAMLLRRGADPDRVAAASGETTRRLVQINARLYSPRLLVLFTRTQAEEG